MFFSIKSQKQRQYTKIHTIKIRKRRPIRARFLSETAENRDFSGDHKLLLLENQCDMMMKMGFGLVLPAKPHRKKGKPDLKKEVVT